MRKKILIILAVIGLLSMFLFKNRISILWFALSKTENTETLAFYIEKTTTLEELATAFRKAGLSSNEKAILALGRYKGLNETNIALGKYEIMPKASIRNVLNGFRLNRLGNGNAEVEVDVTVPNLRFIKDLAGILSKTTLIDSLKFVQLIEDPKTLAKYGFTWEEFPSMFVPNQYKFFYDMDEMAFLDRMASEYRNYWTDERKDQLKSIGLSTTAQATTLASIVFSEQSKQKSEWPIIAGLYLNRIAKGIPLQSDPTFKYCWGKQLDTVQRLLGVHRNIDCAYNTYRIKGLPPGPICLTPTEVISAVLRPEKHNYIYMCAKPSYSGLHNFTSDFAVHSANARLFQNWLGGELAKK